MPEYTNNLVGFYDVLGFSEFVQNHPTVDDVHNLFENIKDIASSSTESTQVFGQRFSQFSDTVIRTTPSATVGGDSNNFGIFYHELLGAIHFQTELIWKELAWIRGAITYGLAFHDASEIYGPAIIRAYELERDVAIFPRIVVDPELLSFLRNLRFSMRVIMTAMRSENIAWNSCSVEMTGFGLSITCGQPSKR